MRRHKRESPTHLGNCHDDDRDSVDERRDGPLAPCTVLRRHAACALDSHQRNKRAHGDKHADVADAFGQNVELGLGGESLRGKGT